MTPLPEQSSWRVLAVPMEGFHNRNRQNASRARSESSLQEWECAQKNGL